MDHNIASVDGQKTVSIIVDHRTARSIPAATVQGILKPVGPLILKAGNPQPPGSPRITPPTKADKKCTIEESQIDGVWMYTLFRNNEERKPVTHKLLYFAGGGFRGPATKEHWSLCAQLAIELPDYEISLVSYPLAPVNTAPKSLPHLYKLYKTVAAQARAEGFRITLMGDSSGGNIALELGLHCASEFLQEQEDGVEGLCPVEVVCAICPATDLRNLNPDIDVVDAKDSLLSRKIVTEVAEGWKGDWELDDPRVSPIMADLSLFRRAEIKVDGITAGYDVLSPDGIIFRDRLSEFGVRGNWLHWEKQMHCFPLVSAYHIKEGVAGKDWIVEVLKENVRNSRPLKIRNAAL